MGHQGCYCELKSHQHIFFYVKRVIAACFVPKTQSNILKANKMTLDPYNFLLSCFKQLLSSYNHKPQCVLLGFNMTEQCNVVHNCGVEVQ